MGRPSLAAERTEQILDAYTRCVGRYGLDGATLERISEESGLSRGHIRHYLGNRDELRQRFLERLIGRYAQRTREVYDSAPAGGRSEAVVRFLFGPEFDPSEDNAAIDAVRAAAAYDPSIAQRMRSDYLDMEATLRKALRDDFPDVSTSDCRAVTYQILAMAKGHWSLLELNFPASRTRDVLGLALRLVAEIEAHRAP